MTPTRDEIIQRDHEARQRAAIGGLLPVEKRLARKERLEAEQARREAGGPLEKAVEVFRRWLYLPDPGALYVSLGAVAANLMPGDPVWLLLVGPPGCGKTEMIAPLGALPYVHHAAVVSPASLLSGTPRKDQEHGATGGLLHQVGVSGIILVKDLTSILSMHREARAEALSALREVYDGRYDRPIGTGGGRVLTWQGKCGLVAGCTPTIDRHHGVMAAMGERFAFYRIDIDNPKEQARRRLANRGREQEMRADLAEAAATILVNVDPDAPTAAPTPTDIERIVAWSHFAVWARTGVERDGYSHDVMLMPSREAPGRLAGVLGAMHTGLAAIGVPVDDAWEILTKLALDSIPDLRRRLLRQLRLASDGLYTADLVALTGIPKTTAERTLEDLALLDIVDRAKRADHSTAAWVWSLSEVAAKAWPPSPETSGERNGASPETSEGSTDIKKLPHVYDDISGEAPATGLPVIR